MQKVTSTACSTARAATFVQVSTSTILCVIVCIALTACGQGPAKTTTTTVEAPDGTVTTKVESTDGSGATSVVGGSGHSLEINRAVEPNQPIDPNNTTVIMGTEGGTNHGEIEAHTDSDGNSKVHVNMPGVHINSNEGSSRVDVDVPFVHIHKDRSGNTHIKTPFVKINARDD